MAMNSLKERLFFLVSGEHPTLPAAEVKAILEAEGLSYKPVAESPSLLTVEGPVEGLDAVSFRSLMTHACGIQIFEVNGDIAKILGEARSTDFSRFVGSGESFAVRVKRIAGELEHIKSDSLEREIGGTILNQLKNVKVNLEKPDNVFLGVLHDGKFLLGLATHMRPRGIAFSRRPRRRPFFHPATMPPKLARCMVNLARSKRGEIFLDPFCGAGGLLIEAGIIGCKIAGSDIKPEMARGSLKNLRFYGVRALGVAVADARKPPFTRVDSIATDPPYGRAASTFKATTADILEDFLPAAYDMLSAGKYLCVASPKSERAGELGEKFGFRFIESHHVYVHRSLTREIIVLKRK
jgi:tRNA (guanine10-N2)-dimethyltransferase